MPPNYWVILSYQAKNVGKVLYMEVKLQHPVPDFKDYSLSIFSPCTWPSALEAQCTLIFHIANTDTHTHHRVGKSLQHSIQPVYLLSVLQCIHTNRQSAYYKVFTPLESFHVLLFYNFGSGHWSTQKKTDRSLQSDKIIRYIEYKILVSYSIHPSYALVQPTGFGSKIIS